MTKKVKAIIVGFVVAAQLLVWTGTGGPADFSVGIIGGADGPTRIIVADKNKPGSQDLLQAGKDKKDPAEKDREREKAEAEAAREKMRKEELESAAERGLLILVNKENSVGKSYKPEDLTAIKYYASDRSAASRYMRKEAADAFHRLVEEARAEGVEVLMTTAYRSYEFQQILYNNYVANEGQEAADTFSAKPGKSEHQTGLAVDVSAQSVGYQLTTEFENTKEGKWLAENAHKYGFIIRFPKGKEDITGYMYEPWHLRYVGGFAAQEIYEQGITLEEYLTKINL